MRGLRRGFVAATAAAPARGFAAAAGAGAAGARSPAARRTVITLAIAAGSAVMAPVFWYVGDVSKAPRPQWATTDRMQGSWAPEDAAPSVAASSGSGVSLKFNRHGMAMYSGPEGVTRGSPKWEGVGDAASLDAFPVRLTIEPIVGLMGEAKVMTVVGAGYVPGADGQPTKSLYMKLEDGTVLYNDK